MLAVEGGPWCSIHRNAPASTVPMRTTPCWLEGDWIAVPEDEFEARKHKGKSLAELTEADCCLLTFSCRARIDTTQPH